MVAQPAWWPPLVGLRGAVGSTSEAGLLPAIEKQTFFTKGVPDEEY